MRRCSQLALTIAIALGFVAVSLVPTQARKPDNPGGGNGGGGSGDGDSGTSTTRFSVIELPVRGLPFAVSEPGSAGVVTVAIDSVEDGYVSAAFAHVERTTGAVLASGYLPEPQFVER